MSDEAKAGARMIRVRVPPETFDLLAARATERGETLAEYTRAVLVDRADKIRKTANR